MKATDEKKKAAVAKQTPKQRQRSLLESLGIVPGAGAAPARPPKSPPLVVGKQRSLDGLAKDYAVADYFKAIGDRRKFVSAACAVLERFDVLVTPTMPLLPFDADKEVPAGGDASVPLPHSPIITTEGSLRSRPRNRSRASGSSSTSRVRSGFMSSRNRQQYPHD